MKIVKYASSIFGIASILFLILGGPIIIGEIAGYIFSDTNTPKFRSPPLTSHAIMSTGMDVQVIGGKGEPLSCSLPSILNLYGFHDQEQPIGLQMRQACITHDYCYRHGHATYGYSQEYCDYQLMQDAFRICLYIARSNSNDTEKSAKALQQCQREAKKINLGVRLAGNSSFKKTKEGSTYFEYDPFPLSSQFYQSYRVADQPRKKSKNSEKAIYTFAIRPHGITMTISSQISIGFCDSYLLPTTSQWITKSPLIVASKKTNNGATEDWLVWFQRNSLENGSSRFVSIAPSRATIDDWKNIFPGFSPNYALNPKNIHFRSACKKKSKSIIPETPAISKSAPASFIHYTGYTKDHCTGQKKVGQCKPDPNKLGSGDDQSRNRTSEFHSAPGLEHTNGNLKLVSLRIGSCDEAGSVLCFSDYSLPIENLSSKNYTIHSFQDPLIVRDFVNKELKNVQLDNGETKTTRIEPQRYRNFVSPPLSLNGKNQTSILAWLYRGDGKTGKDYQQSALLRRGSYDKGRFGGDAGMVKLENYLEENEPIIVLGRLTTQPRIYSFALGEQKSLKKRGIHYWKLPVPVPSNKNDRKPEFVKSRALECGEDIETEWMQRTPVVVAHKEGSGTILFSKMVEPIAEKPGIVVKRVSISAKDNCKIHPEFQLRNIKLPKLNEDAEYRLEKETYSNLLRETPLLAWENSVDGEIQIALPFRENHWRSTIK